MLYPADAAAATDDDDDDGDDAVSRCIS